MWYFIIGAIYLGINIFIRKLTKNIGTDGFWPVMWFLGWPLCFLLLFLEKVWLPYYGKFRDWFKLTYDHLISSVKHNI